MAAHARLRHVQLRKHHGRETHFGARQPRGPIHLGVSSVIEGDGGEIAPNLPDQGVEAGFVR